MWLKVKRERGRHINQELRHSRGYRNPEFFRKMVEHLEIDEIGSSFAPEVGGVCAVVVVGQCGWVGGRAQGMWAQHLAHDG